jgi:hypothetical protein
VLANFHRDVKLEELGKAKEGNVPVSDLVYDA